MRRRSAVGAIVVALALVPATGAAQAPGLLNALEVRRLVDGDEPADHVGLRDHFLALALRYDAEARRQDAVQRTMFGNPNHPTGYPAAHAGRLAGYARRSAVTVRELAVYHERLAAGVPALAPAGAGEFHAGKGAPPPTDREARAVAATARTPADHRAIEEYFVTIAERHRDAADAHVLQARMYRVQPNDRGGGGGPALHCDRLAAAARRAAERADARALVHRQLARIAGTD
jgi:hypothetical protein